MATLNLSNSQVNLLKVAVSNMRENLLLSSGIMKDKWSDEEKGFANQAREDSLDILNQINAIEQDMFKPKG